MLLKLKKILLLPPTVIMSKIYKRLHSKVYYMMRKTWVTKFDIDIKDTHFENWKSEIKGLFKDKNQDYYVEFIKEQGVEDSIVSNANNICEHKFDLLGSGVYQFGDEIQWNLDFKSGFVWDNEFYMDIKKLG